MRKRMKIVRYNTALLKGLRGVVAVQWNRPVEIFAHGR